MNPMSFVILRKHLAEKEEECSDLKHTIKCLAIALIATLITTGIYSYYNAKRLVRKYSYSNYSGTTENQYTSVSITPGETATFTLPNGATGWTAESNKAGVKIVASGACVDKALSILSILERNNKLDDTIYLAVGDAIAAWHVQVVKLNKQNNEENEKLGIIYYRLNEEYNVVVGDSEFPMPPPVFYTPEVFREAAMKYSELSYVEMRDFAAKYTASK